VHDDADDEMTIVLHLSLLSPFIHAFITAAAAKMGINKIGQVCVMIHSGSRGLGHQVATDALTQMEKAMARDGIVPNDRQLACARINSQEGKVCARLRLTHLIIHTHTHTHRYTHTHTYTHTHIHTPTNTYTHLLTSTQDYLAGMAAAANFAWVNRQSMTFLTRQCFAKQFDKTPAELDMHVIYDVSHNIAKVRAIRLSVPFR